MLAGYACRPRDLRDGRAACPPTTGARRSSLVGAVHEQRIWMDFQTGVVKPARDHRRAGGCARVTYERTADRQLTGFDLDAGRALGERHGRATRARDGQRSRPTLRADCPERRENTTSVDTLARRMVASVPCRSGRGARRLVVAPRPRSTSPWRCWANGPTAITRSPRCMQAVDLFDRLTLEAAATLSLHTTIPACPPTTATW